MRRHHHGFTLVELMVVISIIALLISFLIPSMSKAREIARKTQCASNERGLFMAGAVYANDFKGRLPDRGGSGTFPTYANGADVGLIDTVNKRVLGNWIYAAPGWRGAGQRSAFTAWVLDYLSLQNQFIVNQDASGNDTSSGIGFLKPNTPLHCPSRLVPADQGNFYNSPKHYISYLLNGFAVFNNYYAPAQDRPAGYPVLENITDFTNVPGGGQAKIAMFIDVYNHEDGGNVTNYDGSVKGFSLADSYSLMNGDSINVALGYVVISSSGHDWNFIGSPTGDQFRAYPMSQCYYWHPYNGVFQAENGTAIGKEHIKCFGYTYNGQ